MLSMDGVVFALVLFILIAVIVSPGGRKILRWIFLGPPNLRFEELPELFGDGRGFVIEHDPARRMPGADRNIQAHNDGMSIIYHTTKLPEGLAETGNILCTGTFGMIFTLRNGEMTCVERIGGITYNSPKLTGKEENAVLRFMISLRKFFNDK